LLSIDSPFHHRLRILAGALLEGDVVLSEPATVALLEGTPGGYELGPERVFELAQSCVARYGVTPGLRTGLQILARQASIWRKKSLRWRITTLIAGKDGKIPTKKRCWSDGAAATPDFSVVQDLIDDGKLHADETLAAILLLHDEARQFLRIESMAG
jgi:hypothetical protein